MHWIPITKHGFCRYYKDAASLKSGVHEFGVTQYRGPRLCLHGIFKFLKAKGAQSRQYRHVRYRWKPQNPSFQLSRGTRTCIRVHGSGVLVLYIRRFGEYKLWALGMCFMNNLYFPNLLNFRMYRDHVL